MKNITSLTNKEFKKLTSGKFFSVDFEKKDHTMRTYKGCRVDVKCDTKGGVNTVEHKPNLVTVWMQENGERKYRTLNINTIKRITLDGQTITVNS